MWKAVERYDQNYAAFLSKVGSRTWSRVDGMSSICEVIGLLLFTPLGARIGAKCLKK